jgi:LmbE family N-acetylglucosaminyl deacetylase
MIKTKNIIWLCLAYWLFGALQAQSLPTERLSASALQLKIRHLQTTGRVLYVAAHPDDENTRLLAYLANEKGFETAYLSLTRGDGGQNLIGEQQGVEIGLIRTHELLAARRIDGAKQFFSTANDFGYSKSPEETLQIWDKEKVLSDIVWLIRKFRPDVVITRFSPTLGGTHGHHTASAQLALEAFEKAADPTVFPEQLKDVALWQPKRIFWNTSSWFFRSQDFKESDFLKLDIGLYNPLLGLSYGEIAAKSRSQHKSQGFGAAELRGEILEYFQWLAGEKAQTDIFENLDFSWRRLGKEKEEFQIITELEKKVVQIYENYRADAPQNSIEPLLALLKGLEKLPDNFYRNEKIRQVEEIILHCAGIYVEALTPQAYVAAGDSLKVQASLIKRLPIELKWKEVCLLFAEKEELNYLGSCVFNPELNKSLEFTLQTLLPADFPISQPYWLEKEPTLGMFEVERRDWIGAPENQNPIFVRFVLEIGKGENQRTFAVDRNIYQKNTDPVRGELYTPLRIVPPVSVAFSESSLIFTQNQSKRLKVTVTAQQDKVRGKVLLKNYFDSPEAVSPDMIYFQIAPQILDFDFTKKGQEKSFWIEITPPEGLRQNWLTADVQLQGAQEAFATPTEGRNFTKITYEHLPEIVYFPLAKVRLLRPDLHLIPNQKENQTQNYTRKIGYLKGAGDKVAQAIEAMGYEVVMLDLPNLSSEELADFQAIVVGIRAFNTQDFLATQNEKLWSYAQNGGRLIIQYNNSYDLVTKKITPYHLELSRDRVTEENAAVEILDPKHPLLQTPNVITVVDFDGWVQERGLYFPSAWDKAFTPLLRMQDQGETPKEGALLVAPYGKGLIVHTSLSWFRQLPAGVVGAYRLWANLLAAPLPAP